MSSGFPDTNVLIHAFSTGDKQSAAQSLIARGGLISVQSLNEFANVARRKLAFTWDETQTALAAIQLYFPRVAPLDLPTHAVGLDIARRYRIAIYDSMIVAAALRGGCDTLWSEDMHDGLLVDGRLRVVNPFR